MEVWKEIKDYPGYEVSSLGRVKSLSNGKSRKEKILKTFLREGYPVLELRKEKKRKKFTVHRLVAEVFIPNPNNFPLVNHKDEDKLNYKSDNLEWCTPIYNVNYSIGKRKRKTPQDIIQARFVHFMKKYNLSREQIIDFLNPRSN